MYVCECTVVITKKEKKRNTVYYSRVEWTDLASLAAEVEEPL